MFILMVILLFDEFNDTSAYAAYYGHKNIVLLLKQLIIGHVLFFLTYTFVIIFVMCLLTRSNNFLVSFILKI